MPLKPELADKVQALYREYLEANFSKNVKFDTITVEPAVDSEGRDFFEVIVVYDDEHERPDPLMRGHVAGELMEPMMELGLPAVMLESYVPKSDYPLLLELRANPPLWDDDEEDWEQGVTTSGVSK